MYFSNPNQTLETAPIANNNTQNLTNLNAPQMDPYIGTTGQNINFQYNTNFGPPTNLNFAVNATIRNIPTINVNVGERRVSRPKKFTPLDLGPKSEDVTCPSCEEKIKTKVEKSVNSKALSLAIGTLFIGLVLVQTCKDKSIGCEDCQHICPNCERIIGEYSAL